jgi:hypothetical protein
LIWPGSGNDLVFGLSCCGGLVFGFDFADGLDELGIYAGVGFAKNVGIAEIAEGGSEFSGEWWWDGERLVKNLRDTFGIWGLVRWCW